MNDLNKVIENIGENEVLEYVPKNIRVRPSLKLTREDRLREFLNAELNSSSKLEIEREVIREFIRTI